MLVICGLVGCGGGRSEPDAKRFFDDGPFDQLPQCAVQWSLGALKLVSTTDRYDRTGVLTGRTAPTLAELIDTLVVDYVKPTSGGFELNTAIELDPNPAAMPYGVSSSSAMSIRWGGSRRTRSARTGL